MYKKYFPTVLLIILGFGKLYADDISFSVVIHGVAVNTGIVYGAIYSNDNNYKKHQPDYTFQNNSTSETLYFNLQISTGEYVIEVYQDINGNGQLDFGLFNIPKEPIGITNYNGRGIPGNFNRQKITINNGTIINIQIYRL
jgi:uncharacterized protein (DUF2141 family)